MPSSSVVHIGGKSVYVKSELFLFSSKATFPQGNKQENYSLFLTDIKFILL
jgi:hypothetical protein